MSLTSPVLRVVIVLEMYQNVTSYELKVTLLLQVTPSKQHWCLSGVWFLGNVSLHCIYLHLSLIRHQAASFRIKLGPPGKYLTATDLLTGRLFGLIFLDQSQSSLFHLGCLLMITMTLLL